MKRLIIILLFIAIVIPACAPSKSSDEIIQTAIAQTQAAKPSDTPIPTATQTPQPSPTLTATTTRTPRPTKTPTKVPTPTPIPEPIVLTGSGDSVVDLNKTFEGGILHITGNKSGRHFAVKNYDAEGNPIDLLVNTTNPYDGYLPIDWQQGEETAMFEISASGDWTIEVLPLELEYLHIIHIPGVHIRINDDVIFLQGNARKLSVTSPEKGNFAIWAYDFGNSIDLLVNEIGPYSGTVVLNSGIDALVVKAEGEWTAEFLP